MKVSDLINHVPFSIFADAARVKFNDTFVQHEGVWYHCQVDISSTNHYYGSGPPWLFLEQGNRAVKILKYNSFEEIKDIENTPEWPTAGLHWLRNICYEISYAKRNTYKAGLPHKLLKITKKKTNAVPAMFSSNLRPSYIAYLLNQAEKESYPKIAEAVAYLKSPIDSIPLSPTLSISVHPYINSPILSFHGYIIGTINKKSKIQLMPEAQHLEEYTQHIE